MRNDPDPFYLSTNCPPRIWSQSEWMLYLNVDDYHWPIIRHPLPSQENNWQSPLSPVSLFDNLMVQINRDVSGLSGLGERK